MWPRALSKLLKSSFCGSIAKKCRGASTGFAKIQRNLQQTMDGGKIWIPEPESDLLKLSCLKRGSLIITSQLFKKLRSAQEDFISILETHPKEMVISS